MPLLAFNKTAAPVALAAGNPIRTLPASAAPPARGPSFNVTAELRPNTTVDPAQGIAGGLDAAAFTALQVQVTAGDVEYLWTRDPEYQTGALVVTGPPAGTHASTHQNGGGDEINVGGLSGTLADPQTPATHATSHESGGADVISVTPAILAVADSDGLATAAKLYIAYSAGAGGAADDVTVYNANAPFKFRILDVYSLVATGDGAAGTVQLRDAAGGAGNVLSKAFSSNAAGSDREDGSATSYATVTVAASGSLYIRRADSGAAGEMILDIIRVT